MMLLALILRTAVTLAFLWVVLRAMGKRHAIDVGPLDLIVALLLGALAQGLILGDLDLRAGLFALGMLAWLHLIGVFGMSHSTRVRGWLRGEPAVLVRDGRVRRDILAREGITDLQFESLLREAGVTRLGEIAEMRLEADGTPTVTRRAPTTEPAAEGETWQRMA
jgi:uncharacterized membrane protein YcaP (DUF421 family)